MRLSQALRYGLAALTTILAVLLACLFALVYLPKWVVSSEQLGQPPLVLAPEARTRLQREVAEARLKARNDARVTGVQLLGVLAVIGGGLLTWRTIRLTRQGQLTERFGAALEQLGAQPDNATARVGGVYSLGRIARESSQDHWPIIDLLSGYVRRTCSIDESSTARIPSEQLVAIAAVLRRRKARRERATEQIDLSKANLSNVDLQGATLTRANMARSVLSGAVLKDADLRRATFQDATLRSTQLEGANLRRADLRRADLTGASLRGADFRGAKLEMARWFAAKDADKAKGLTEGIRAQSRQPEPRATTERPTTES